MNNINIDFKQGAIFANNYVLKRKLGSGSFGTVWLAHNNLADIDVAIKIYWSLDESGLSDFRKEFKIAYNLQHQNLLHINHFDVYNQHPFLVMPYCSNGSVSSYIGKLNEKQIWQFIKDVSAGLDYLHSQRPAIIHQDIKPDNILIDDNGRFLISDFGISNNIELSLRQSTKDAGISAGTIAYMGPERFEKRPVTTPASDIWSLGMSIYELITGDVLWNGRGGSVLIYGASIPPLPNHISPKLSKLIHNCLSLHIEDRPTARQIYECACDTINNKPKPPKKTESIYVLFTTIREYLKKYWKYCIGIVASVILILILGNIVSGAIENGEIEEKYKSCKTIPEFKGFIESYPESDLVPHAKIKIKKLEYKIQNYFFLCKTIEDYEKFIIDYPYSELVDDAEKKIKDIIQKHFESCKTKEDYEQFIKNFPDSELVDSAKMEIEKLKEKPGDDKVGNPRKPRPGINPEEVFFKKCETIKDYQDYLKTYPNGKYVKEASGKIKLLQQKAEDRMWEICKNKDTIDAYESYIRAYPKGRYKHKARVRIQELQGRL